jgi:histidinol-phosphatase (PHP family)
MHTVNSDGRSTIAEMCQSAVYKGVSGITITDHADMNFYESRDTYNRIKGAVAQIRRAQVEWEDKLELMCGVELGEYLYEPENAKKILGITMYDSVLCSIHLVPAARWEKPYNRIDFANDGTDEELLEYMKFYFDLLSETVDAFDFDILAHIACPVRYMTTKHGRAMDVMRFEPKIREILHKIIDRGIALEWNSAGLRYNKEIFALYYSMGGRLVTLGSDAHGHGDIARGFDEFQQTLKACGFTHYHYYKNRQARGVEL